MTDRPPWVANRIADLALEAARDQRTLARIRALTARALEAGLLLDPAEVEAVLDGAWCPLCLSECGHSTGGRRDHDAVRWSGPELRQQPEAQPIREHRKDHH